MRRQGNISCSSKYDGACIARGVLTLDSRVTTPVGQMLNPPGYRHDINLSYGGGARGRHLSSTVRRTARSSVMGGSGRHGCGQAHTARPVVRLSGLSSCARGRFAPASHVTRATHSPPPPLLQLLFTVSRSLSRY